VLALVFAMPASAGYITIGVAEPPPPPPPSTTTAGTTSADGFMQTGFTSNDPVTEAALTFIQIVLALP
jgi:hypothetical protein